MKKLLLSSALLCTFFTFGQTFHSEDFNSLTLGNVGTDVAFTAAGQGGFFTFADNGDAGSTSTNASNANFQIVATGENNTNGLQVEGVNGSDGFRQIQQPGFTWSTRTTGNDIAQFEISFNTGGATTSENLFRWILRSADPDPMDATMTIRRTLSALQFTPSTKVLRGLANLNNAGAVGFFGFDLGPDDAMGNATELVLPANTWVRIGISWDSTDGRVRWKTDFNNTSSTFTNAANNLTGVTPSDVIIIAFDGSTPTSTPPVINASAATIRMDNMETSATATDELLSVSDNVEIGEIKLYPNPTNDVLNVQSSGTAFTSYSIMDYTGRIISTTDASDVQLTIETSSLKSGIYMLQLDTDNGSVTKRFVKN